MSVFIQARQQTLTAVSFFFFQLRPKTPRYLMQDTDYINNGVKFALLSILLISGCATSLEYLSVPTNEPGWKLGYENRERFSDNNLREFIPENESINNWSKIITIQYISGKSNVSPEEFATVVVNDAKKACSDIKWNAIEVDKRSIIYEWYTKGCPPPTASSDKNIYTPQHELARIIFGNNGVHKASYNEKTKNLSNETRSKWIDILKETQLEKDGKVVNLL